MLCCSRALRDPHSFPTRRSSDLVTVSDAALTVDPSVKVAVKLRDPGTDESDGLIRLDELEGEDRKSTRLNSSHRTISYAVFCLKKKKKAARPSARATSPRTRHRT